MSIGFFPRLAGYAACILVLFIKLHMFGKAAGIVHTSQLIIPVTAGSVLLATAWLWMLPRRHSPMGMFAVSLMISLLIAADLLYYRYFGDFVTVPAILQAGQLGALGGSIVALVHWSDVLFFVDLPFLLVAARFRRRQAAFRYARRDRPRPSRPDSLHSVVRAGLAGMAAVLGCLLAIVPLQRHAAGEGAMLLNNRWWNLPVYQSTGLLGFHAYDLNRWLVERFGRVALTDAQRTEIDDWFAERRSRLAAPTDASASCRGCNVVLVQAEAMQAFVIGRSVNGKAVTPHLNELAEEAAYFPRFYAQVGQGRTADAEFAVNASLYPLPSGAVYRRFPEHDYDFLPQVLQRNGYATYAFHAYERSFWNRHVMYARHGIDHFHAKGDFGPGEQVGWSLGDRPLLARMTEVLAAVDGPFYALAVLLSGHHPFTGIPAEYHVLELGDAADSLEGRYLQAMHYTDRAIGEWMAGMKETGLWDNTIVVIYGDHDAGLTDFETLGKLLDMSPNALTQARIKHEVPLFIHIPGRQMTVNQEEPAGMVDLAPTVLDVLGMDAAQFVHMGERLTDPARRPFAALRYGSFADSGYFYLASKDGQFANGTCFAAETEAETDLEACRDGHARTLRLLQMSDRIIVHDLLKKLKK